MSITPPEHGTPATPLYDETIAAPDYDDLRVPTLPVDDDLRVPTLPVDDPDGQPSGGQPTGGPETDGPASGGPASEVGDRAQQAAGAAKSAAGDVKDSAKDAAAGVASTGKEQASKVAKDALGQARDLYGQATTQLSSQAGTQQEKAASTLHTFADDLGGMSGQGGSGLAAELVQSLETRARGVAEWLEQRDPEDVLEEVKRFAARRPAVFIGLAAITGIVAARLTKALVAEAKDTAETTSAAGPAAADLDHDDLSGPIGDHR